MSKYFKKKWPGILIGVLALPLTITLLQMPYQLASLEFTEAHLLELVKEELSKDKFVLTKKIPYFAFDVGNHRMIDANNYQDCGDICLNLGKDGYVDKFYGTYKIDDTDPYSLQNYKLVTIYNNSRTVISEVHIEVFIGKVPSRNKCYKIMKPNYLQELFGFENRYLFCQIDGNFLSVFGGLEIKNAFFQPWDQNIVGGTDYDVANLNWYTAIEHFEKIK